MRPVVEVNPIAYLIGFFIKWVAILFAVCAVFPIYCLVRIAQGPESGHRILWGLLLFFWVLIVVALAT